jgi:hypothetical protein
VVKQVPTNLSVPTARKKRGEVPCPQSGGSSWSWGSMEPGGPRLSQVSRGEADLGHSCPHFCRQANPGVYPMRGGFFSLFSCGKN